MTSMGSRVHVLGAGAIGLLWGSYLSRAGVPITLLLKSGRAASEDGSINKSTMVKVTPSFSGGGTLETKVELEDVVQHKGPISRLLVTTKSYDVLDAIRSVRSRLHADSVVVLLSNGMGFLEDCKAAGLLQASQIVLATTTHGAIRRSQFEVEHTGFGQSFFGFPRRTHPDDQFQDAAEGRRAVVIKELASAGLGCTLENDIMDRLWRKLCVNACINPLTALLGCRNGKVRTNAHLQQAVDDICGEVALVTAALGRECPKDELRDFVNRVAEDTGRNESSMYRDVQSGRRTEIDYINGYIVRRALECNCPVPVNRTLVSLIQAKESLIRGCL